MDLQAWDISIESAKVLFLVLQTMQFCLRTGFGVSKDFYCGSLDDPTFGLGQGNGTVPPAFVYISDLVVNVDKRMGNGNKLTLAYTYRMILPYVVIYVDDTDLLHVAPSQEIYDEELVIYAEESSEAWGLLTQATGDALKQSKYFTYFMY